MLTWIPRHSRDLLRPPRHLKDFQKGWFEEFVWAAFDNVEAQGYLPVTSDLWRIAGAHNRDYFEKHKSAVLACFDCARVVGREMIFLPAMIELISAQLAKVSRHRRRVSDGFSTDSQVSTDRAGPSPSQSEFDFSLEVPKSKPKSKSVRESIYTQADFNERDLRRMKEAQDKFERMSSASVGTLSDWMYDEKKVFEWICRQSGITVSRGLELEKVQFTWPEEKQAMAAAGD